MRARTFEYRLSGLPGVLALVVLGVLVLGLVALLVMVGAAVAVAGLAISAGAALYYAVRRKLAAGVAQFDPPEDPAPTTSISEVREIEVEVLPGSDRP